MFDRTQEKIFNSLFSNSITIFFKVFTFFLIYFQIFPFFCLENIFVLFLYNFFHNIFFIYKIFFAFLLQKIRKYHYECLKTDWNFWNEFRVFYRCWLRSCVFRFSPFAHTWMKFFISIDSHLCTALQPIHV